MDWSRPDNWSYGDRGEAEVRWRGRAHDVVDASDDLFERQKEEEEIRAIVAKYAGDRRTNVVAAPYDLNRSALLRRLERANLAFMLSLREGFGLTGWEAIGAEVPLIVSKSSGVYQLIKETSSGLGLGYIQAIEVKGPNARERQQGYAAADVSKVAELIVSTVRELAIS